MFLSLLYNVSLFTTATQFGFNQSPQCSIGLCGIHTLVIIEENIIRFWPMTDWNMASLVPLNLYLFTSSWVLVV